MELSQQQAQRIVKQVMEVIPYNINIMNAHGVIIASGDPMRIGVLHPGAQKALSMSTSVELFVPEDGAKPGLNTPIMFQDQAVGVIGITGDPHVVRPFSDLVRVMAELLIQQDALAQEHTTKKQHRDEFLYEYVYRSHPYTPRFIEKGIDLGVDVTQPKVAVAFRFLESNYQKVYLAIQPMLLDIEYAIPIDADTIVCLLDPNYKTIQSRLEAFVESHPTLDVLLSIGNQHKIVSQSLLDTKKTMKIKRVMHFSGPIIAYQDVYFMNRFASFSDDAHFVKLRELIEDPKHEDLLMTLKTYIRLNGEMNKISDALHIHRNTLTYRLDKIYELTGKEPRHFMDLLELFIAFASNEL